MTGFLQKAAKPGLPRILAAIFYDLWLVAALWMLGATLDTMIRHAITGSANTGNHLLLQAWFLLSPFAFFGWFWTHGGQTLGMRSWRIRVVDMQGREISWGQAFKRFLAALVSWGIMGLGYLWILFDRDGLSWHDRVSGTCLVLTRKQNKPKSSVSDATSSGSGT